MSDSNITLASEQVLQIMNENILKKDSLHEEINICKNKFVAKAEEYKKINMTTKLELERSFTLEQFNLNIITKEKELKNIKYLIERCKVCLKYFDACLNNNRLIKKTSLYEFADVVIKQSRNNIDDSISLIKQKVFLYKKYEELLNYYEENNKDEYFRLNHLMISKKETMELFNEQEILENKRKILIDTFINQGFVISEEDLVSTVLLNSNIEVVVDIMYNTQTAKEEKKVS